MFNSNPLSAVSGDESNSGDIDGASKGSVQQGEDIAAILANEYGRSSINSISFSNSGSGNGIRSGSSMNAHIERTSESISASGTRRSAALSAAVSVPVPVRAPVKVERHVSWSAEYEYDDEVKN